MKQVRGLTLALWSSHYSPRPSRNDGCKRQQRTCLLAAVSVSPKSQVHIPSDTVSTDWKLGGTSFVPHLLCLSLSLRKTTYLPPPPTTIYPRRRIVASHITQPPDYPLLRHRTPGRDLGLVFFSPTSPASETLAGAASGYGNTRALSLLSD